MTSEEKKMDDGSKLMWRSLLDNTTNFQDRMKIYSACPDLQPCIDCVHNCKKAGCTHTGGASKCGRW